MLKPVLGSQLNLGSHLTRGLVGCWLMNEGSGTEVFDLSGYGRKMSFVNSPVWSSGKHGSAILLDDASDQYLTNASGIVTATPITFFALCYTDATGLNQQIIAVTDASTSDNHFRLQRRAATDGLSAVTRTNTAAGALSIGIPAVNTWFTAGAVFASPASRICYLDGIGGTEETTSLTPNAGNIDTTSIGAAYYNSTSNLHWSGKIALAMIWKRALFASEMALLHRAVFQI